MTQFPAFMQVCSNMAEFNQSFVSVVYIYIKFFFADLQFNTFSDEG